MKTALICSAVVALFVAVAAGGCKSTHEEGVKSDLRTQWTKVAANTKKTTDAAKEVLDSRSLKDVTASSTDIDGVAKGKQADGTLVKVDVKKLDAGSEVSVTVGTLGSPKLGAELAKEIKMKAEAK